MITDRQGQPEEGYRIIASLLLDCDRVLDLGCGPRHHSKNLPNAVCVDLDPKHAPDPRVLIMDVRESPQAFRRMHFDAVLMSDLIEHLPKDDGVKLIREVEPMADRIVVFTPLGDMWVTTKEPDNPHHHRCGWFDYEFRARGYQTWVWPRMHNFSGAVFGAFYAWKWMKGETPTAEQISELSGVK